MNALAGSIVALFLGPVVYSAIGGKQALVNLLDGFVIVSISAVVVLGILPDAVHVGGWWVLAAAGAGLLGPTLAEHHLHKVDYHGIEARTHVATLILGLTGLWLHALLDGAALATAGPTAERGRLLGLAIGLHRLPVGLTIWWLLRPSFGALMPVAVIVLVAGVTVVGYTLVPASAASGPLLATFQAFVSGSLLHVVFFRPHLDAPHSGGNRGTEDRAPSAGA